MLVVSLIVLLVIIFVGMVFFLRNILNRNIIAATTHLEQLSSEYAKREEEIRKQYEEAKRQTQEILFHAQKDAQAQKEKILKEAQEGKERVLNETQAKVDEMMQQADRARQALLAEVNLRIEEKAIERAAQLLEETLPEHIREEIHRRWLEDLILTGLDQLERLHLPEGSVEGQLICAFALSQKERQDLIAKIQEKLGRTVSLREEVDPNIIAGLVVHIGSLVLDGSLKFKIQEVAGAHRAGAE